MINKKNKITQKYKDALNGDPLIHPDTLFGENVRLGRGVIIEKGCEIGDNTFIGHYTVLRPKTKIGKNTVIGHHNVFEGETQIGNDVLIEPQCHISKDTIIEDNVFIAPYFCTSNTRKIKHGRNYELIIEGPTIRKSVRIGIGVKLFPGIEIGENAQIGVGSVVTKNVPPREIWFGNPAVYKRDVPEDEIL